MKPARFIFNSDLTTLRNTGHIQLSIIVPNSFTVGSSERTIGTQTAKIGDPDNSFFVYFTSSLYDYVTTGFFGYSAPDNAYTTPSTNPKAEIYYDVTVSGDTATFRVTASNLNSTYTNYGQTITAHILTFKDPFSE